MDWNLMLDFKKNLTTFVLSSTLLFLSSTSFAADEEVGHYVFGQARYFGPKLDIPNVSHVVDEHPNSATRFYPSLSKHLFSYLKNNSRTIKDAISYGDWDKPYRLISGFEYDYKNNKSSSSSYGYKNKSGSLFVLGDKAYQNNYIRLGGGVALTKYESDYENHLKQNDNNVQGILYAIYNDAPNQIRLRSRLSFGYGRSKVKRKSILNDDVIKFHDDLSNWFYGFENALSKTFQHDIYFIQPQLELNGLGIRRGSIAEHGFRDNTLQMDDNNLFSLEGILTLYAGVKGTDAFNNRYNLKFGPGFTRILNDPYDAFYAKENASGDIVRFKERYDKRDYITWKLVGSYGFDNGWGVSSEFRYYKKDEDSIAWLLGVNYSF